MTDNSFGRHFSERLVLRRIFWANDCCATSSFAPKIRVWGLGKHILQKSTRKVILQKSTRTYNLIDVVPPEANTYVMMSY